MSARLESEEFVKHEDCEEWATPPIEDTHGEHTPAEGLAGDARRAIVLASKGWHAGVIGIVAARIVERYHRPTILIALENGEGQGSGRSIRNFDLHAALVTSGEFLTSFGGHAMAAGLRIAEENVAAFTEAFVATANNRITHEDLVPKIRLDAEISLSALSLQVVESVSALGPFGNGNPKPKLATQWLELAEEPRLVGRDSAHLSARFREGGVQIKSIGFGLGDQIEALKNHRRCRGFQASTSGQTHRLCAQNQARPRE